MYASLMRNYAATLADVGPVAAEAHRVLCAITKVASLGTLSGTSGPKKYVVFQQGSRKSRPYLDAYRYGSVEDFEKAWDSLIKCIDVNAGKIAGITATEVDKVLYAATHAFACAFDIGAPGGRATNGKLFELITSMLLEQLLRATPCELPQLTRPAGYRVPVDIVLERAGATKRVVVATKITSRERLVQAFVHNHFLTKDQPGRYCSIVWCGSETNALKGEKGLQETCVHHQINAYCEWLGPLDGLYYLDVPAAYARAAFARLMPVASIGQLLTTGVHHLLT
jgi:hypothetical protein